MLLSQAIIRCDDMQLLLMPYAANDFNPVLCASQFGLHWRLHTSLCEA